CSPGEGPKVRTPGCEARSHPSHLVNASIDDAYPPNRAPTGLPQRGGLRVAPPTRKPRSGGSQGSPGEGPKVRTPGCESAYTRAPIASPFHSTSRPHPYAPARTVGKTKRKRCWNVAANAATFQQRTP